MASTTKDGGKMTVPSATKKAIVTSSATKPFHLPTEQAHDIPSRRPGEIFDFMALSGELRNAIYQAVIDTMATTPDNPIVLTPGSSCVRMHVCGNHELDRIPVEELAETERTTKSTTNLATCHLGEVSRQIRSEFVPMLMDSLHFRICRDMHNGPGCQSTIQAPIHQLAGIIRHLDYYTHGLPKIDPAGDVSKLFDTLLSLRFNGELKFVGRYYDARLIPDYFETFCSSMREGESRTEAQLKASEKAIQVFILCGTMPYLPWFFSKTEITFRFNCNDFLGEHVQT